ncbi:hypothetical protein ANCCAN_28712 [Ancylostoma caninum]|uniref:FAR1 domain-containing protein n=1 Tax=Ancylostoma caninum TaxID=29170 RepID=A0A368F0H1_ANCCA|nr:hypothetical protein ANCCAN_28712 [Ancylostoma caninum]
MEHDEETASTSASVQNEPSTAASVQCPGSEEALHTNMELAEHCEKDHSNELSDFAMVHVVLHSWENFETWLAEERGTFSKLMERGYTRKRSKGNIYMYVCQHARGDGGEVDSQETMQRYKKTKRVHKHCPCFAKVHMRSDRMVEVAACFGHLVHDINSTCHPLSIDDEITIMSMLANGVPHQTARLIRFLQ